MDDNEFLTFMEQSIPEYAKNCFINAGYDTLSVVAQMKTIGSTNSLDEIESFILKHFSEDDSCFPPTAQGRNDTSVATASKQRKFVFPPGHRIRITDFINSAKSKYALTGKKRSSSSTFSAKKQKNSDMNDATAATNKRAQTTFDLKEIADDVRRRITDWLRKQAAAGETYLSELKEFKDYKVSVKLDQSDHPCASVYCELCNKPYKLVSKKPQLTMMLSNWTGHIKACIAKHKPKDGNGAVVQKPMPKQQPLLKYVNRSAKTHKNQPSTGSHCKCSSEEGQISVGSEDSLVSKQVESPEKVSCMPNNDGESTDDASIAGEGVGQSESCNIEPQDFFNAPLAVVDQEGQLIPSQNRPKVYSNWSYAVRQSKLHLKFVPDQYLLTNYCSIVDTISKAIDGFTPPPHTSQESDTLLPEHFSTSLFRELLRTASENCKRVPQARRHTEIVKKFSLSVLLRIGSTGYELLHKNMPEALPSLSTVKREAAKRYTPLIEGEFSFDQLVAHLEAYSASRMVSISEDATRVISRVEYDQVKDKLVGFVLPLDEDSLPLSESFQASTLSAIEEMFEKCKKASSAYVYMAQSLSPNTPPFCLCIIGTDNCFDANMVTLRWKYIIKECKKRNVEVVSFSADGDSRLITSMRVISKLYNYTSKKCDYLSLESGTSLVGSMPITWKSWFFIEAEESVCFVQDTVHLGVKLKARLLTLSQVLPMGKYAALASHLHLLQATYHKEHHNLRYKDLDHQDRQNFEAVNRIISSNVLGLLDSFPDAKGTKCYLQMVKSIVDSYLDKQLSPLHRVEEAWFAVFFARYWRQWIVSCKKYKLETNYITLNSYICIELNAHALILLLMLLRDKSKSTEIDYLFCPWLLGSQPCEKVFRAARSMTPTFSTMVNFNILGLLRRLHKLQIQIEIESQSSSTGIIFPNNTNKGGSRENQHSVKAITNEDIEGAVKSALHKAKNSIEDLGMKDLLVQTKNWDKVSFGDVGDVEENNGEDLVEENDQNNNQHIDDGKIEVDKQQVTDIPTESDLSVQECKDVVDELEVMYSHDMIDKPLRKQINVVCRKKMSNANGSDESMIPLYEAVGQTTTDMSQDKPTKMNLDKRFLEVMHSGGPIYIRKTTIIWLLQEGERVSSDRLFRVRAKQPYNCSTKLLLPSTHIDSSIPQVNDTIKLGDFCFFRDKLVSGISIVRVDQFSKNKEKLKRDRQVKENKVSIRSNIGALCSWFTCTSTSNEQRTFTYTNDRVVDYVQISQAYICTLFEGCFSKVQHACTEVKDTIVGSSHQSHLFTARELTINEETASFIHNCTSTTITKLNCSHEVVELSSDDESDNTSNFTPVWVIHSKHKLTTKDKHLIESGKQLTDILVNFACGLLKEQFPLLGGFQSTLLQNSKLNSQLRNPKHAIQVIHLEAEKHWVTVSTIGCDENIVNLYDSSLSYVPLSLEQAIVALLKPKCPVTVKVKNVIKQVGSTDCGVYALAYCTSLALGSNPCLSVYRQVEMRDHLISCMENLSFSTFPLSKKRRLSSDECSVHVIEICPICLLSDNGTLMVLCEQCSRWYHKDCVPSFSEDDEWICAKCKD